MFKKILIAYDGSDYGKKALRTGIDLAYKYSGSLDILTVINLPDYAGSKAEVDGVIEKAKGFYAKNHDDVIKILEESKIPYQTHIKYGHTGHKIVRFAEKNKIDLIITGARGFTQIEQILLGSTSTYIVRHSPCTVLVIKETS